MRRWHIQLLCLLVLGLLGSTAANALELISDGSFERSGADPAAAAWLLHGEATVLEDGIGHAPAGRDTGFAGVTKPSVDYQDELVQPLLPLTPGQEYILTVWARIRSGSGQAVVGVRQEDTFPRMFRTLGANWEKIELAFTPTAGWAQVVFSCSAGAEIIWDDVTLQESDALSAQMAEEWEARIRTGESLFTGLVVDARGTGLERGMSPRIVDEEGNLLFAGIGASNAQLYKSGLAAYVRSTEEAVKHPRLKVSEEYPLQLPLTVSAQKAIGYPAPQFPPTTAVVGAADAAKIRAAVQEYDFFGRFAIVFVID